MNDFNVCITIEDCFVDDCCNRHTFERQLTISNPSQTVVLFDDFVLNIVRVTDRFFTVLIQNGIQVVIRNIFTTFPMRIVLPNRCGCRHIVTIGGTIIST